MSITIGLLALFGVTIDLTVVAALLAIIGYSLNDTIVVFDRIREFRRLHPNADMKESIDRAVAQTMSRTLATSLTTLAVVTILFFFGGEGIASFSATLLIGLLLGTYSSVFVAAPVLLIIGRGKGLTVEMEDVLHAQDGDPEEGEEVSDEPKPVYDQAWFEWRDRRGSPLRSFRWWCQLASAAAS